MYTNSVTTSPLPTIGVVRERAGPIWHWVPRADPATHTRDARPPATFCATARRFWPELSEPPVRGVFFDTRRDGRQYSAPPPGWPHSRPVRTSFHLRAQWVSATEPARGDPGPLIAYFSRPHRRRLAPALPLWTWPLFLRHLAVACAARALHLPYRVIVWL